MDNRTKHALETFVELLEPKLTKLIEDALQRQLDDKLLTIAEAADFVGITIGALSKRIQRGSLPIHRVGESNSRRIRRSDLYRKP